MSSRQSIAATQRISRSLAGGARQARAANAHRTIARHILESTIEYPELAAEGKQISIRRCLEPRLVGQVVLLPGMKFLAIASKFAPRYYIVAMQNGEFTCSCKDRDTAALVIGKAQAFIDERKAAKVA